MRTRIALALVGLLVLTALLTWPLCTEPVAAYTYPRSWRYCDTANEQNSSSAMAGDISIGRRTYGGPTIPPGWSFNITFGQPRQLGGGPTWIVDLTVPQTTFRSTPGYDYEPELGWINTSTTLAVDGYGWLFLNATGDVDCYTSNNSTGAYWISPSPMAGTKAADPGQFPSTGPDGVAGTGDDGFGDGTNDPRGSSVLYMKTNVDAYYASAATLWDWYPLFNYDMIQPWTTAVAYDIVTEGDLNGVSARYEGHAWEFFSGEDSGNPVPYDHAKWNAYVTYVMSWSQHDIDAGLGLLDLLMGEKRKLVRFDCVICDIDCNEKVTITDVVIAALAFGAEKANLGPNGVPDGPPPGGDDKIDSDPNWDPRGDYKPDDPTLRGKITISDIVAIALDFGASLTPNCVIRP